MAWWRRTRKTEEEAPTPPSSPQPETDAEFLDRVRREYAEKDRRVAAERVRQEKWDAAQQARRDAAQRELVLRVIARSGVYFPGDLPEEIRPGFEQIKISGDDPEQSGGDAGPWYGWLRWPR